MREAAMDLSRHRTILIDLIHSSDVTEWASRGRYEVNESAIVHWFQIEIPGPTVNYRLTSDYCSSTGGPLLSAMTTRDHGADHARLSLHAFDPTGAHERLLLATGSALDLQTLVQEARERVRKFVEAPLFTFLADLSRDPSQYPWQRNFWGRPVHCTYRNITARLRMGRSRIPLLRTAGPCTIEARYATVQSSDRHAFIKSEASVEQYGSEVQRIQNGLRTLRR